MSESWKSAAGIEDWEGQPPFEDSSRHDEAVVADAQVMNLAAEVRSSACPKRQQVLRGRERRPHALHGTMATPSSEQRNCPRRIVNQLFE